MCKIYEYVIDMHITVLENNIVTRQLGFTNLDEKAHLCQVNFCCAYVTENNEWQIK